MPQNLPQNLPQKLPQDIPPNMPQNPPQNKLAHIILYYLCLLLYYPLRIFILTKGFGIPVTNWYMLLAGFAFEGLLFFVIVGLTTEIVRPDDV